MQENDVQLTVSLIDIYANLQRIKHAADKDKEVDYQLRATAEKAQNLWDRRFDLGYLILREDSNAYYGRR